MHVYVNHAKLVAIPFTLRHSIVAIAFSTISSLLVIGLYSYFTSTMIVLSSRFLGIPSGKSPEILRLREPSTIAFFCHRYLVYLFSLCLSTSQYLGGNIEAVEICLNNGGKIDDQQEDLSTPVHLAASQGSLEILKLMFNCQAELKSKVIGMTDVQGMTPLHKWDCSLHSLHHSSVVGRAAMGDHVDVIEFLLESVSYSVFPAKTMDEHVCNRAHTLMLAICPREHRCSWLRWSHRWRQCAVFCRGMLRWSVGMRTTGICCTSPSSRVCRWTASERTCSSVTTTGCCSISVTRMDTIRFIMHHAKVKWMCWPHWSCMAPRSVRRPTKDNRHYTLLLSKPNSRKITTDTLLLDTADTIHVDSCWTRLASSASWTNPTSSDKHHCISPVRMDTPASFNFSSTKAPSSPRATKATHPSTMLQPTDMSPPWTLSSKLMLISSMQSIA